MSAINRDHDLIKCEDGSNIYWIPKHIFARVVLESETPYKKFVRYKSGAKIYDVSERLFRDIAKAAEATYKINQTVLVNLDKIDEYLEYFHEEK